MQVNSAAVFKDVAGNELVLTSPYVDDTVVTVTTGNLYDEGEMIHVLATIPAQPGNKIFARLSGELP